MGEININYQILGNGPKTIVFLHGWGGSVSSFMGYAMRLKDKYRCILVDFAGFGLTPEPSIPYKLSDYTNDLDALLIDLRIKECFFVAHSFGGRVAMKYLCGNYSIKIKGAILFDVAGVKPKRKIGYYVRVGIYKIRKRLHLSVDRYGSSDYKMLSDVMKGTFINIVNEYLNKELYNIHCPTLLIWGEYDVDTPLYMAKCIKKKISDASLIILKGKGHFAYLEDAYRCINIVDSFVGGID